MVTTSSGQCIQHVTISHCSHRRMVCPAGFAIPGIRADCSFRTMTLCALILKKAETARMGRHVVMMILPGRVKRESESTWDRPRMKAVLCRVCPSSATSPAWVRSHCQLLSGYCKYGQQRGMVTLRSAFPMASPWCHSWGTCTHCGGMFQYQRDWALGITRGMLAFSWFLGHRPSSESCSVWPLSPQNLTELIFYLSFFTSALEPCPKWDPKANMSSPLFTSRRCHLSLNTLFSILNIISHWK